MNIEKALQKVLGFGAKVFIEKAVERGWEKGLKLENYNDSNGHITFSKNGKFELSTSIEAILLDPRAWQSVGKVELWYEPEVCVWEKKMYQMIDALIELSK